MRTEDWTCRHHRDGWAAVYRPAIRCWTTTIRASCPRRRLHRRDSGADPDNGPHSPSSAHLPKPSKDHSVRFPFFFKLWKTFFFSARGPHESYFEAQPTGPAGRRYPTLRPAGRIRLLFVRTLVRPAGQSLCWPIPAVNKW